MAVNRSRDMLAELQQGIVEGSYINIAPGWGGPNIPVDVDRYSWPTYQQAERHIHDPFAGHPLYAGRASAEVMTGGTPSTRSQY